MSSFLQYGYLGLIGLVIVLSYQIVIKESARPFKQTIILLMVFIIVSLSGGAVGYLWASKELEAANAKKSAIAFVMEQVQSMRENHEKEMEPLQNALSDASKNMTSSLLDSTRKQYRDDIIAIAEVIRSRDAIFASQLSALQSLAHENIQ